MTQFDAAKSVEYFVDAQQTGQWYFQYGIGAALSASLAAVTKDRAWLELGRQFLAATAHCRDDVFRQATSGKIGWGAAWMIDLTRDPADRAIAEAVYANLFAAQQPAGWWSMSNIYQHDAEPSATSQLDLTGEFTNLMGWMEVVVFEERSD